MIKDPNPKVSIIIPVYNGTNYLREAVDSALAQTYSNCEVIVVDDGSTDETWNVIQSYGTQIRGLHKENGGVASALNCGIQNATGELIAWLSHDDLFLPRKIERQVFYLQQNPQFSACYTDYYEISAEDKILREVETPWFPGSQVFKQLFRRLYINGSTMLIERTCFDRVGLFSENLRYTQDAEMWFRILAEFDIGRVPEKLGKQRFHLQQWSKKRNIHIAEEIRMYKHIFEKLGFARFFPDIAGTAGSPSSSARAYTWLGDTMSVYRGWYGFAYKQYLHALRIYPDWRNPAWRSMFLNLLRGTLRPVYYHIRRSSGSVLR